MNIVLFNNESKWKLIDFDSAVEAGIPSKIFTTMTYASPEILLAPDSAEITVDPSVDAYSVGIISYELLSGRTDLAKSDECEGERLLKRFYGNDVQVEDIKSRMLSGAMSTLDDIDERQTRSFIRKFLCFDPAERKSTMRALQSSFFRPADCTSMVQNP